MIKNKAYFLIIACLLIKISLVNAQELSNESILPTEVLGEIFKHIKNPEDLKNIRLTSKEFRSIVPIEKISIKCKEKPTDQFLCDLRLYADAKKALEDLKNQKNEVRHLSINSGPSNIIPFMLTDFRNIEKITMTGEICTINKKSDLKSSLKEAAKYYKNQNEAEKKELYEFHFKGLGLNNDALIEIMEEDKHAVDELLRNQNVTLLQELSKCFPKIQSLTLKNIPNYSKAKHQGLSFYTGIGYETYTLNSQELIKKFEKYIQENIFNMNNSRLYVILAKMQIEGTPEIALADN